MKLDKLVKKIWVDALRSGEYKQARGGWFSDKKGNIIPETSLSDNPKTATGYCCLGVLRDLCSDSIPSDDGTLLPARDEMADFIGREEMYSLVARNDGTEGQKEHSFEEIADYIEKNL